MAIGGGLQLPALVQRILVDASGTADADRQIGSFASSAGAKFAGIAKGALALAGITGIGAIGVSIVKTGADFTKSLNAMAAVAGVPGPELEKLRQLAIRLGADTTFSANEAAAGMLELAKAGISTADIMGGALANTLSLATAGELDLANAATIVGQAMNTFNLTGRDSQRVVDALAGAANSSSADVADLSQALAQGGQAAAMAGLSVEETTAALALFADNGLRGSDAGTSLKNALLNLVPTSKEAQQLMKELGLEFVNQDGSIKSLVEIQRELKEGLGGLTEAQQQSALKTLFGTDAYRAMGTLLNATEGELQGYIAATSNAGTASEVAAARMKGLPGVIERISGGFETIQLAVFQILEPALVFVGTLIANLMEKLSGALVAVPALFSRLREAVEPVVSAIADRLQPVFEAIGGFIRDNITPILAGLGGSVSTVLLPALASLAGLIGGAVMSAISGLIGVLSAPAALFGALVGGVVYAYQNFEGFRNVVDSVVDFFTDTALPAIVDFGQGIGDAFSGAVQFVRDHWDEIQRIVGAVVDFLETEVVPRIVSFGEDVGAAFGQAVQFVRDHWDQIQTAVSDVVGFFTDTLVPAVATFVTDFVANFTPIGLAVTHFDGLKAGASAVLDFFTATVVPAVTNFVGQVVDTFAGMVSFVRLHWDTISSIIGSVITAVRDVVVITVTSLVEIASNLFSSLVEFVRENWDSISLIIGTALNMIRVTVETILNTVKGIIVVVTGAILVAWKLWGDELVEVVRIAWDFIKGIVDAAINVVLGVIQTVLAVITGDWSSAWDGIKMILEGAWTAITTVVETSIRLVGQLIEAGLSVIRAVWDGVWLAIRDIVTAAWEYIKNLVAGAIESMRANIEAVMIATRAIWTAVWNEIRNILSVAWDFIRATVDAAINAVRAVIDSVMNAIRALWGGHWDAIRQIVGGAWDFISNTVRSGIEGVRSIVDSVMGAVRGAWDSAWNAMKGTVQGALDGIRGIWDGIRGAIGAPINAVLGFLNTLIRGANTVLSKIGVGTIPLLPNSVFHEGGLVGEDKGSRKGRRGKIRDDEEVALLQKGEGVLPKNVVAALGKDRFEQLRRGEASLLDPASNRPLVSVDRIPPEAQRRLAEAQAVSFRPRETDAPEKLRPETGGFPGQGIVGGLIQAGIDAVLDQAQNLVRGVMAAIDGAMSPFGTPGKMAAHPPKEVGNAIINWLDSLKSEASQAQAAAPAGGTGQLPPGGSTIDRLIGVVKSCGAPHRVTSTYRAGDPGFHGQRRAVDFAGPRPSRDSPELARIFGCFGSIEAQLRELIYAGPQVSYNIKNGRRVGKYAQADHHDHVHAALAAGGRLLANRLQLVGERGPELVVPSAPAMVLEQRRTAEALGERARTMGMGISLRENAPRRAEDERTKAVTVAEGAVKLSIQITGADNPEEAGRRAGGAAAREILAIVRAA